LDLTIKTITYFEAFILVFVFQTAAPQKSFLVHQPNANKKQPKTKKQAPLFARAIVQTQIKNKQKRLVLRVF
jgi:hypothetical protein